MSASSCKLKLATRRFSRGVRPQWQWLSWMHNGESAYEACNSARAMIIRTARDAVASHNSMRTSTTPKSPCAFVRQTTGARCPALARSSEHVNRNRFGRAGAIRQRTSRKLALQRPWGRLCAGFLARHIYTSPKTTSRCKFPTKKQQHFAKSGVRTTRRGFGRFTRRTSILCL